MNVLDIAQMLESSARWERLWASMSRNFMYLHLFAELFHRISLPSSEQSAVIHQLIYINSFHGWHLFYVFRLQETRLSNTYASQQQQQQLMAAMQQKQAILEETMVLHENTARLHQLNVNPPTEHGNKQVPFQIRADDAAIKTYTEVSSHKDISRICIIRKSLVITILLG